MQPKGDERIGGGSSHARQSDIIGHHRCASSEGGPYSSDGKLGAAQNGKEGQKGGSEDAPQSQTDLEAFNGYADWNGTDERPQCETTAGPHFQGWDAPIGAAWKGQTIFQTIFQQLGWAACEGCACHRVQGVSAIAEQEGQRQEQSHFSFIQFAKGISTEE